MTVTTEPPANIRHYRRLARIIATTHFGKEPSRIVYKSSGLTNYVFAINHVEGQFVIRISPEPAKLDVFKKELWATQRAREVGVPTPEVLAVGNETVREPYMISRQVNGLEATHYTKRRNVVHELARYAALINSIPTTNFGESFDWSTDEGARWSTWPEYIEHGWQVERRMNVLAEHRLLSQSHLRTLCTIVEEAKTIPVRPALNHGDLRLKNVIVDDAGQITAIIDWEECLSTIAPQWDLSIALHDLSIDEKQSFIDGYGLSKQTMEEIAPLVKAFNILNYSNAIEGAVERKDSEALDTFKLRLNGCFDLYSL